MFKKVKGLILRRKRFGEAHAYITALTEEGLIVFSAYGIMSPKSKSFAACQPYTLSEFVLSSKGNGFTLSQASAVSYLIRQGMDLERLSLANYIASMASETSFSPEDAPSIYALTCTALSLTGKEDVPSEIIKAVFELRLTAELGFYPDLEECAVCGKKQNGGLFLPSEGGIICNSCLVPEGVKGVTVSEALVSAIAHMLTLSHRQAFGIRFTDSVEMNAFCTLAERFSSEHLDCAVVALNFYKQNIKNF